MQNEQKALQNNLSGFALGFSQGFHQGFSEGYAEGAAQQKNKSPRNNAFDADEFDYPDLYGAEYVNSQAGTEFSRKSSGSLQASFARPTPDSYSKWRTDQKNKSSAESSASDIRREGPFVGVGPKHYRRSDERILEDVNESLTHHPEIDASEIVVTVKDGIVTLSGTIASRQMKHWAEESAATAVGVQDIKNELRIDTTTITKLRTSETGAQAVLSRTVPKT